MIPMQSSKPTKYLPRFSPLCPPDKALNLMTAALIFHFPSFTSIQCTIIPWNPTFIVFTDHLSWVTETFPGVACSDKCYVLSKAQTSKITYSYILFQQHYVLDKLVVKMCLDVVRSDVVDFSLIKTRVFWNAALSARVSGYRYVMSKSSQWCLTT